MKQKKAAVLRHIIDSLIVTVLASGVVVVGWSIGESYCGKVFAWIARVGFGYIVIAVGGGSAVLGWSFPRGVIASCRGLKLWPKHWGLVVRGFVGFVLAVVLGKLTGLLEVEAWGVVLLILEVIVLLFLVLCVAAIVVLMHSKLVDGIRREEEHTETNDRPIRKLEEDDFDHKETARRVFDLLRSGVGDRGPNVAIVGPFGSGKTSLCNLTEDIYKNENKDKVDPLIFCHFEAWQFLTPDGAVRGLLDRIVSSIEKLLDCSGLGGVPDEYIGVLKAVSGKWSGLLVALLKRKRNPEEVMQTLQNVLLRIDKRVVVFVDDFDRLEKQSEESQQAVAAALNQLQNLTNVQYVLCVGPMGEGPDADLLKLTRFQVLMPVVSGEEVVGRIKGLRDKVRESQGDKWYLWDMGDADDSRDSLYYNAITDYMNANLGAQLSNLIRTPRGLKAVERETQEKWQGGMDGEISWYALLLISALKVEEQRVFEWVLREPNVFLEEIGALRANEEKMKKHKTVLQERLQNLLSVDTNERFDTVGQILVDLFPKSYSWLDSEGNYLIRRDSTWGQQRLSERDILHKVDYFKRYIWGGVPAGKVADQPTLQFIHRCDNEGFRKEQFEQLYLASLERQTNDINTIVRFSDLLSDELGIKICDCMLNWFCDREHWEAWDSTGHYVSTMMSDVRLIAERAGLFESEQGRNRYSMRSGPAKKNWAKKRMVELVSQDVIVAIVFAEQVCRHLLEEVVWNAILGKAVREEFLGNTEGIWEAIKGDRKHLHLRWVLDALTVGEEYEKIRGQVTERVVERLKNECAADFAESVIISLVRFTGQPDRGCYVEKDENEKTYDMGVLLPVVAGLRGRELEDAVARKAFDVLMKAYSEELKGLEGESGGDSQEEGDVTC